MTWMKYTLLGLALAITSLAVSAQEEAYYYWDEKRQIHTGIVDRFDPVKNEMVVGDIFFRISPTARFLDANGNSMSLFRVGKGSRIYFRTALDPSDENFDWLVTEIQLSVTDVRY